MIAFRAIAVGIACVIAWPFPASAKKADVAWAECIWSVLPTSASNWLAMPEPKANYDLDPQPAEYVLQFRLRAACHASMSLPKKAGAPQFDVKAVRAALNRLRPMNIRADTIDPMAFRCTRFFDSDTEMLKPAGYDWGFGNNLDVKQLHSERFVFAVGAGDPPLLPSDWNAVRLWQLASGAGPAAVLPERGGLRKCRYIRQDGALKDA